MWLLILESYPMLGQGLQVCVIYICFPSETEMLCVSTSESSCPLWDPAPTEEKHMTLPLSQSDLFLNNQRIYCMIWQVLSPYYCHIHETMVIIQSNFVQIFKFLKVTYLLCVICKIQFLSVNSVRIRNTLVRKILPRQWLENPWRGAHV